MFLHNWEVMSWSVLIVDQKAYLSDPFLWTGRFVQYVGAVMGIQNIPDGFAVFNDEIKTETGYAQRIFFTPEAYEWGKSFGAEDCDKPENTKRFAYSTGKTSAWDVYFPKKNR